MRQHGKNYLAGKEVDDLLQRLFKVIEAKVLAKGGRQVRSMSLIVGADIGMGVANAGCTCSKCQIDTVMAYSEACGSKAELVIDDDVVMSTAPVLHS